MHVSGVGMKAFSCGNFSDSILSKSFMARSNCCPFSKAVMRLLYVMTSVLIPFGMVTSSDNACVH